MDLQSVLVAGRGPTGRTPTPPSNGDRKRRRSPEDTSEENDDDDKGAPQHAAKRRAGPSGEPRPSQRTRQVYLPLGTSGRGPQSLTPSRRANRGAGPAPRRRVLASRSWSFGSSGAGGRARGGAVAVASVEVRARVAATEAPVAAAEGDEAEGDGAIKRELGCAEENDVREDGHNGDNNDNDNDKNSDPEPPTHDALDRTAQGVLTVKAEEVEETLADGPTALLSPIPLPVPVPFESPSPPARTVELSAWPTFFPSVRAAHPPPWILRPGGPGHLDRHVHVYAYEPRADDLARAQAQEWWAIRAPTHPAPALVGPPRAHWDAPAPVRTAQLSASGLAAILAWRTRVQTATGAPAPAPAPAPTAPRRRRAPRVVGRSVSAEMFEWYRHGSFHVRPDGRPGRITAREVERLLPGMGVFSAIGDLKEELTGSEEELEEEFTESASLALDDSETPRGALYKVPGNGSTQSGVSANTLALAVQADPALMEWTHKSKSVYSRTVSRPIRHKTSAPPLRRTVLIPAFEPASRFKPTYTCRVSPSPAFHPVMVVHRPYHATHGDRKHKSTHATRGAQLSVPDALPPAPDNATSQLAHRVKRLHIGRRHRHPPHDHPLPTPGHDRTAPPPRAATAPATTTPSASTSLFAVLTDAGEDTGRLYLPPPTASARRSCPPPPPPPMSHLFPLRIREGLRSYYYAETQLREDTPPRGERASAHEGGAAAPAHATHLQAAPRGPRAAHAQEQESVARSTSRTTCAPRAGWPSSSLSVFTCVDRAGPPPRRARWASVPAAADAARAEPFDAPTRAEKDAARSGSKRGYSSPVVVKVEDPGPGGMQVLVGEVQAFKVEGYEEAWAPGLEVMSAEEAIQEGPDGGRLVKRDGHELEVEKLIHSVRRLHEIKTQFPKAGECAWLPVETQEEWRAKDKQCVQKEGRVGEGIEGCVDAL
ncbi:uncharacterized protein BXZ73DRAFT_81315 [Epithele typhae]|uniref:uncharacterized protein n=1 Tax=Epithele typhae TaxID=378194 RepID=UPI00200868CC|nr:uncharacterized protein BXZ73DRAFT_81315 [Epithele typhae]KAH9915588.1 hypothetical protein BXZ73DRAFT_81315 [Epithele typhae]